MFGVKNRPKSVLKYMIEYDLTFHCTCCRFETVVMTIFKINSYYFFFSNFNFQSGIKISLKKKKKKEKKIYKGFIVIGVHIETEI